MRAELGWRLFLNDNSSRHQEESQLPVDDAAAQDTPRIKMEDAIKRFLAFSLQQKNVKQVS